MRYLLNLFLPKASELRRDQINMANTLYLHHQAEAERHAGLAAVYKLQATRLVGEITEVSITLSGDERDTLIDEIVAVQAGPIFTERQPSASVLQGKPIGSDVPAAPPKTP